MAFQGVSKQLFFDIPQKTKSLQASAQAMSTTVVTTRKVVQNANECTDALAAAVDAMNPPIDVYEGILRLIAEFVPYREFRGFICLTQPHACER